MVMSKLIGWGAATVCQCSERDREGKCDSSLEKKFDTLWCFFSFWLSHVAITKVTAQLSFTRVTGSLLKSIFYKINEKKKQCCSLKAARLKLRTKAWKQRIKTNNKNQKIMTESSFIKNLIILISIIWSPVSAETLLSLPTTLMVTEFHLRHC